LEREMAFISKTDSGSTFVNYLVKIKEQLNKEGICVMSICKFAFASFLPRFIFLFFNLADSTTIHLKVAKVQPEPGQVEDYHVPVIICPDALANSNISLWDLTTQQVSYVWVN